MDGAAATDRYRIALDGDWSLRDLYEFPYAFEQVYALLYVAEREAEILAELEDNSAVYSIEPELETLGSYPWKGGYSAVNFYKRLSFRVPKEDRPRVLAIQYASPGWIDLGLTVGVAVAVSRMVKMFVARAGELAALYHEIYKQLHERGLMRLEAKERSIQLTEHELEFLVATSDKLCGFLGVEKERFLKELAPNELARLKILLSLYRRVRVLGGLEQSGKAKF